MNDWQEISSAPMDGTTVVVLRSQWELPDSRKPDVFRRVDIALADYYDGKFLTHKSEEGWIITHWAPIPPIPPWARFGTPKELDEA